MRFAERIGMGRLPNWIRPFDSVAFGDRLRVTGTKRPGQTPEAFAPVKTKN